MLRFLIQIGLARLDLNCNRLTRDVTDLGNNIYVSINAEITFLMILSQ